MKKARLLKKSYDFIIWLEQQQKATLYEINELKRCHNEIIKKDEVITISDEIKGIYKRLGFNVSTYNLVNYKITI